MNIFVTDPCPRKSAQVLPDKHIVKMPLETCQMAAVILSDWHWGWGEIHKFDERGLRTGVYSTKRGGFRHHPCTVWAAKNTDNFAWMLAHGFDLMDEYTRRYGKVHACYRTLCDAMTVFHNESQKRPAEERWHLNDAPKAKDFARAMPDEFKYDTSISTFDAYKMYVASKPWVCDNYLRLPERKPSWV